MTVLQRQLRDRLGRASKVHPISVERHVVEGRVVNLRIKVESYVAASCLILFPNELGRFGFAQMVVFGGMPNSRRYRCHQSHVKDVWEARGDDVAAPPYQDR